MSFALLDNPVILMGAFYPRQAGMTEGDRADAPNVFSGTIPLEADSATESRLGYRLYVHTPDAPVILYFHGNAEIAPDYDDIATFYHGRAGASLLVVDFRGFGWSTGRPTFAALIEDAPHILNALPDVLTAGGVNPDVPRFVMGRSMGSVQAIEIAYKFPDRVKGLIIESGFADVFSLLVRLGFAAEAIGNMIDPLGNERKMREIDLPLLVIHGEQDTIIPVSHGQRLYDACPHPQKRILRVPRAGHNDLMAHAFWDYFAAIAAFIRGGQTEDGGIVPARPDLP